MQEREYPSSVSAKMKNIYMIGAESRTPKKLARTSPALLENSTPSPSHVLRALDAKYRSPRHIWKLHQSRDGTTWEKVQLPRWTSRFHMLLGLVVTRFSISTREQARIPSTFSTTFLLITRSFSML